MLKSSDRKAIPQARYNGNSELTDRLHPSAEHIRRQQI